MSTTQQQVGGSEIESLDDAVDVLSELCDGYSDRVNHGATIITRLHENDDVHDAVPAVYKGHVEMDVLRYGLPAVDVKNKMVEQAEAEADNNDEVEVIVADLIEELIAYAQEMAR